jgi:hypothetical protein
MQRVNPAVFHSRKTGRGPLQDNWQETCEPVMCTYKLARIKWKVTFWRDFLQGRMDKVSFTRINIFYIIQLAKFSVVYQNLHNFSPGALLFNWPMAWDDNGATSAIRGAGSTAIGWGTREHHGNIDFTTNLLNFIDAKWRLCAWWRTDLIRINFPRCRRAEERWNDDIQWSHRFLFDPCHIFILFYVL